MTREVTVRIEGRQMGESGTWDEPIIVTARGSYLELNNKHYIQYEEKTEEQELVSNMLKITLNRIDMTKKGATKSQMAFDINDVTEVIYQTPYGSLGFEVRTSKLTIEDTPDLINVDLEYALYSKDNHISDNRTAIMISSIK